MENNIINSWNPSIICISDLFWDEHWSSEQQLMSRFAKKWPVIYIERPVSVFSFFTGVSDAPVGRQFIRWLRGGIRVKGDHLFIVTPPPFLPFRYNSLINKINQFIRTITVRRVIRKFQLEKYILWIYEPDAASIIGKLSEILSIYHCADNWTASGQWWNAVKHIKNCEENLVKKVSIVFATSRKIYNDKKEISDCIHYMPNGVSLQDFSVSDKTILDIKEIKPPLVGCVALFNDRYDYEMLAEAAKTNNEWSFVFIGSIITKDKIMTRLKKFPNVFILGNKSRALLGSYIRSFDVCLIPYKPSAFANSVFPLKLMEYFFFGKPVVSLRIPTMDEYNNYVYQYDDFTSFIQAIKQAILEKDPIKQQQRRNIALNNTWEQRVEQIEDIIYTHHIAKKDMPLL